MIPFKVVLAQTKLKVYTMLEPTNQKPINQYLKKRILLTVREFARRAKEI